MSNSISFTGNGETTTFYFTFPFFGVNDIHVTIDGIAQTTDVYTLTPTPTPDDADTEYTGGKVVFATAPASGASIVIYRDVELVRHIDYQPTLQPQSYQLNQDFNQCMAALQELRTKITNAIGLANIPTVASLLSEIATIRDSIPNFLTADDLDDINDALDDLETAITTLNGYDYVIESQNPTADNNYTWYRKYKSGWVEQGCDGSLGGSGNHTVTLPVEMANTNYLPVIVRISGGATTSNVNVWARRPSSTTSFIYYASDDTGVVWRVSGKAA